MKKTILLISLFITTFIFSQDLTWTGNADTDFFNEDNWQYSNGSSPTTNILMWNQPINLALQISDAANTIIANGIINLGSGSLSIANAVINGNALSNGTVTLNLDAYLELSNANPLQNNVIINFTSGLAWLKVEAMLPSLLNSNHISNFRVNNNLASYQTNLRVDNYYANGTIVRSIQTTTTPAIFYDLPNLTGDAISLTVDVVHSGNAITNLNNKIESIVLKKGFMLTIADDESGTGISKNYIASEADLIIDKLPTQLLNKVSFVRIVPWNWVSKKGIGGDAMGLQNTWHYRWANTGNSTLDVEYAPMAWGANGADDDADITLYKQKYKATHVMGFNEPDDCNGQSGQYRNLCQEDVAVGYYRNLMKTGLRTVSPAGRENTPKENGWLHNFYKKATSQNIRIDVIAVHWYDWSSNPEVNTNPTAQQVFDRFKAYLTDVYNRFGLPIWITEFNANPNRSNAINYAFMQLALPYLESLDYVERYAWFEPSSDVADYYDGSNNLTNVGAYYKNFATTASIPENTVAAQNNIDVNYSNKPTLYHNLITNGDFSTGDLKAWLGTNHQVVIDEDDPNTNLDISKNTAVGSINTNAGNLYQILEVAPGVSYTVSFDYKWITDTGNNSLTARVYRDLSGTTTLGSVTLGTNPDVWYNATFNFTAPTNVFKARLFFDKASGNNQLRITNVKVTLNPSKIWDGSTNNDWNTASNWVGNTVPTTTDVVFIPRGLSKYPTLTSNITLEQLVIDFGSSFITNGTVTGGTTFYVDLNDDAWHLLSSPVATQVMNQNWVAAAGIATGTNNQIAIGSYQNETLDSSTNSWVYFKSTDAASNFENGKGYAMKKLSKGMFVFNGSISAAPKNINITQGAISNWNLIGNPYPSFVDVSTFISTNSTALSDAFEAIYVWDANNNMYKCLTEGFIHPGQAFFVNSADANTSVSITESMLSHQENGLFYKTSTKPKITVYIEDDESKKSTEINYLEGKTKGLDPSFDIGMFDGDEINFSIYTHLVESNNNVAFCKQYLPNQDLETLVIPLGIKADSSKEYTFKIDFENLPSNLNVYLEDRLNSTFTKFEDSISTYKVTFSTNVDGIGRFYVHTKSTILNTSVTEITKPEIVSLGESLYQIKGISTDSAQVTCYTMLGKISCQKTVTSKENYQFKIPEIAKGIYVFEIKNNDGKFSKKIMIY